MAWCGRESEGLAVIGCTAAIVTVLQRYSDGRVDILCEGGDRFEIEMLDNSRAYLQAEVDTFRDEGQRGEPVGAGGVRGASP